jgi:hypothetical protein
MSTETKWYTLMGSFIAALIFTFFMSLLLILSHNDQERYLAKVQACKSASDFATCINLATGSGH